ncbi:hypothetical protein Goklo_005168 [Gossypium klotzschianum]|uniref:Uncharacterized protein n=1 Tax=Gossypium klotzschianum TaxID=34286 RepID=A0A7J8VR49_9ROSI|nr:hypothetical protein [Gossypium klotzschianum]
MATLDYTLLLEMVSLLLNCKANKHAANQHSSTTLCVAQRHNSKERITILNGCFIPGSSYLIISWRSKSCSK